MRRWLGLVALLSDVVVIVAVFLPWASATGGTTVAGWGSGATPRLTGLFVLAIAATALAFRCGTLLGDAADRALPHVVGALLDAVDVILTLTVVAGAAAFAGTSGAATPRVGAWLALVAAAAGLLTGVGVLALGTEPAWEGGGA